MEQACHFFQANHQQRHRCSSRSRCYAHRLPRQRPFADKVARLQHCHDGLFAVLRDDRDLHNAPLNVHYVLAHISLAENSLVRRECRNPPFYPGGIEEVLGNSRFLRFLYLACPWRRKISRAQSVPARGPSCRSSRIHEPPPRLTDTRYHLSRYVSKITTARVVNHSKPSHRFP